MAYAYVWNQRVLNQSSWCHVTRGSALVSRGHHRWPAVPPPSPLGQGTPVELGRCMVELQGRGALPLRSWLIGSRMTSPQGHALLLSLAGLFQDRGGGVCKGPESDKQEDDGSGSCVNVKIWAAVVHAFRCVVFTWWGGEARWTALAWALQSWGSLTWRCRC